MLVPTPGSDIWAPTAIAGALPTSRRGPGTGPRAGLAFQFYSPTGANGRRRYEAGASIATMRASLRTWTKGAGDLWPSVPMPEREVRGSQTTDGAKRAKDPHNA